MGLWVPRVGVWVGGLSLYRMETACMSYRLVNLLMNYEPCQDITFGK